MQETRLESTMQESSVGLVQCQALPGKRREDETPHSSHQWEPCSRRNSCSIHRRVAPHKANLLGVGREGKGRKNGLESATGSGFSHTEWNLPLPHKDKMKLPDGSSRQAAQLGTKEQTGQGAQAPAFPDM
ncbi:WD repeat and SOCS box-containing protein 1 [Platysternon megacephalum]|uniref:WD repeat and SOCS box-containing protein 1 n=1 Tax=Platysternon megacephalum TaxID=55544 RepID=A0A4D9F210_9SAUR|nr:WD repeat and SOCS box-containing protein 1 [Platysternon megacephalum]